MPVPSGVSPLPPPNKDAKKARITVWLDPDLLRALRHEAIDREMSVGDLIDEAVRGRITTIWKK